MRPAIREKVQDTARISSTLWGRNQNYSTNTSRENSTNFAKKYPKNGWVDARALRPFRVECALGLLTICQAPQSLEPKEGHTNERLSKHASAFLEWFREIFVFIYVDKISSRFAIVGRWLYSISVVQFLESSKITFEEVGAPASIVRRLNTYVKTLKIVTYANKDQITGENTLEEPTTLKIFYLVPKKA